MVIKFVADSLLCIVYLFANRNFQKNLRQSPFTGIGCLIYVTG